MCVYSTHLIAYLQWSFQCHKKFSLLTGELQTQRLGIMFNKEIPKTYFNPYNSGEKQMAMHPRIGTKKAPYHTQCMRFFILNTADCVSLSYYLIREDKLMFYIAHQVTLLLTKYEIHYKHRTFHIRARGCRSVPNRNEERLPIFFL